MNEEEDEEAGHQRAFHHALQRDALVLSEEAQDDGQEHEEDGEADGWQSALNCGAQQDTAASHALMPFTGAGSLQSQASHEALAHR